MSFEGLKDLRSSKKFSTIHRFQPSLVCVGCSSWDFELELCKKREWGKRDPSTRKGEGRKMKGFSRKLEQREGVDHYGLSVDILPSILPFCLLLRGRRTCLGHQNFDHLTSHHCPG